MPKADSDLYFGFRGDRVRATTAPAVNRRIDEKMQRDVQAYAAADPQAIEERIETLDHEWDIERTLEMNASLLSLIGLGLGWRVNKRWYALPAIVSGFLLQHAVQGWCPPLPFLRRLGMRSQREIEAEKYALKALQKLETSKTESPSTRLPVGLQ